LAGCRNLNQPFGTVLFVIVLRLLCYMEIFPTVAVPWTMFVKVLPELFTCSAVFANMLLGLSLLQAVAPSPLPTS
jgi:hypothetical protein